MRTNVVIDDGLMKSALKFSGLRTKNCNLTIHSNWHAENAA